MRLNPYHPERFWSHLGRAQYTGRCYADAIGSYSRLTKPDQSHHAFLAAASAQLGNRVSASAHAREVLARQQISPSARSSRRCTISNRRTPNTCARVVEGGAAGLAADDTIFPCGASLCAQRPAAPAFFMQQASTHRAAHAAPARSRQSRLCVLRLSQG
jgi:hypothetical protein